MKKYKIAFLACFLGLFLFTACESNPSTIQPESKQGKSYSTLTALPAHEYAIFLSKQIVVVTNELESRIIDGKNVMSGKYPRKDAVFNVSASLKRIDWRSECFNICGKYVLSIRKEGECHGKRKLCHFVWTGVSKTKDLSINGKRGI